MPMILLLNARSGTGRRSSCARTGIAKGEDCMWNSGRDPFDAFRFFALQVPCMVLGSLLGTLGAVAILQALGV
jgi:hypothetical protein